MGVTMKPIDRDQRCRPALALAAAALAGALLAGCAGQGAASSAVVPEYVFTYAENQSADYPTALGAQRFADLVREETGGRIVINVYTDSEKGNEPSVLEQLRFGGVDFARVSVMSMADSVEAFNVLQLPYLYDDRDHMWRVLDSGIGEKFLTALDGSGMVGLSWYDAGARHFYNWVRPVETLDDLAGLRIRVAQSQLMYDMVRALGATPVTVSYEEVYSALETRAIDGAENNWPSYQSERHWEVAPCITLDAHSRIPELQLCAQSTWNRLSESDRSIILRCARESALYERELWAEAEASAQEKLQASGCVVTELSDDELARFRKAVEPLYRRYAAGYEYLVSEIRAMADP